MTYVKTTNKLKTIPFIIRQTFLFIAKALSSDEPVFSKEEQEAKDDKDVFKQGQHCRSLTKYDQTFLPVLLSTRQFTETEEMYKRLYEQFKNPPPIVVVPVETNDLKTRTIQSFKNLSKYIVDVNKESVQKSIDDIFLNIVKIKERRVKDNEQSFKLVSSG